MSRASAAEQKNTVRSERDGLMYEKIAALISRNDLATAERLLKKHDNSFTQAQKDALAALIASRRRHTAEDARRRERRLRTGRFRGRHWRAVRALKIGSLASFAALGWVLYPYSKMCYFTTLSSWDGPPFQHRMGMELLYLAELALLGCFFGLNLADAHRRKGDQREALRRAERSGKDEGDAAETFAMLEKRYRKEEKGWQIALLCVFAGMALQLAAMAVWF